jgi:hypothetical protein
MLDDWVTKLSQDLGVKPDDVAISEILDLARDAAAAVARPAAPITTFIVGYAAGLRGGGRDTIAETVRQALAAIAAELPPSAAPGRTSNGASHGYGAISGSTQPAGSTPVPSAPPAASVPAPASELPEPLDAPTPEPFVAPDPANPADGTPTAL